MHKLDIKPCGRTCQHPAQRVARGRLIQAVADAANIELTEIESDLNSIRIRQIRPRDLHQGVSPQGRHIWQLEFQLQQKRVKVEISAE